MWQELHTVQLLGHAPLARHAPDETFWVMKLAWSSQSWGKPNIQEHSFSIPQKLHSGPTISKEKYGMRKNVHFNPINKFGEHKMKIHIESHPGVGMSNIESWKAHKIIILIWIKSKIEILTTHFFCPIVSRSKLPARYLNTLPLCRGRTPSDNGQCSSSSSTPSRWS